MLKLVQLPPVAGRLGNKNIKTEREESRRLWDNSPEAKAEASSPWCSRLELGGQSGLVQGC